MNRKIVGILVGTLLFATAVLPVVGDIEYYIYDKLIEEKDIQGEYNIISDGIKGKSELVSSTLKKVAVIFVKFLDFKSFAKGSIEEGYLPLLEECDRFYDGCSYDQVDIVWDTYGPYTLDNNHEDYYPASSHAPGVDPFPYWTLKYGTVEYEALLNADSDIKAKVGGLDYYDIVGIVINDPDFNGGIAVGGNPPISIVQDHREGDEWWGVFAHELGHNLGLPHLTGDTSRIDEYYFFTQYRLPYCVMSQMPPCEFTSWCRIKMGWLPSPDLTTHTIEVINWGDPLNTDTVNLKPLAANSIPGVKAIKIPIVGSTSYYLVENRNYNFGYDDNLKEMGFWEGNIHHTEEGILIYRCDDSRRNPITFVADDTEGTPGDVWDPITLETRIWEPWTDATYMPSTSKDYIFDDTFEPDDIDLLLQAFEVHDDGSIDVIIQLGEDPKYPDTHINEWDPPPYDSEDIWVDNEYENDLNQYKYHVGDDFSKPRLNGDDPWAGHDNFIRARIHNKALPPDGGTANIGIGEVKFYVCDLSTSSSDNPEFDYIGDNMNAITIGPGESDVVSCPWKPKEDPTAPDGPLKVHVCIKVVVAPQSPYEPDGNQIAQENIDWYNVGASSPSGSLSTPMLSQPIEVNNPSLVDDISVRMYAIDPPEDWTVLFDKEYLHLDPGQKETVYVTIQPPVWPPLPVGTVEMINIGAKAVSQGIPGDCIINDLGGVTMMVKITEPSSFRVNLNPSSGMPGDTFDITGYLEPAIATRIIIDLIKPDGTIIAEKIDTYSNGRFSHSFTPYAQGNWKLRAIWGGDDTHSPAISDEISFNVEYPLIIDDPEPKGRGGKITVDVENTGEVDIVNVPWSITLDGGFIILGRNTSGTNVTFPAGEKTTLESDFIFGFGRPTIIINIGGKIKEVDSRVFLFFIFGLE